jgi:hypothetical protein
MVALADHRKLFIARMIGKIEAPGTTLAFRAWREVPRARVAHDDNGETGGARR